MTDVLLVMHAGLSAAARQACLAALQTQATLTATMGPRVWAVRAPEQALDGLRALPGVWSLIRRDGADVPGGESLPADLDEGERLFVAGWLAQGRKGGPRPGEGRDWDAPGFSPPDGS